MKNLSIFEPQIEKHYAYKRKNMYSFWIRAFNSTLRAESFAGRNLRDFHDFDPFSRKLMPGKKLNEKFAKVILAKKFFFPKFAKVFSKFEQLKIRWEHKKM